MNDVVDVVFIAAHGRVLNNKLIQERVPLKHVKLIDVKNVELRPRDYPNSGTFFTYGVDGKVCGKNVARAADTAFGYSTLDKIFDKSITMNNYGVKGFEKKDGLYYPTKIEHAKEFKYGPIFPNMVFFPLTDKQKTDNTKTKYGKIKTHGNINREELGGIYYFNGDTQKIIAHVDVKSGQTLDRIIKFILPAFRMRHNREDKHVYIFLHTCLGENIHQQYLKNTKFNSSRRYFQRVASEKLPPLVGYDEIEPYFIENPSISRRCTTMNFSPPERFSPVSPVRKPTKRRKLSGGKNKKTKKKKSKRRKSYKKCI